MDEITRKRLDKIEDNINVKVADVLKMALYDLERGAVKADGVLIILVERSKGQISRFVDMHKYRAGLTKQDEILTADIAHAQAMMDLIRVE